MSLSHPIRLVLFAAMVLIAINLVHDHLLHDRQATTIPAEPAARPTPVMTVPPAIRMAREEGAPTIVTPNDDWMNVPSEHDVLQTAPAPSDIPSDLLPPIVDETIILR